MLQWLDRVGRLNHAGQRLLHRVSIRGQLFTEEGRYRVMHTVEEGTHRVMHTVEEGRSALQTAASSMLHTLATPVAWTDDVLDHKVPFLGWTRERLNTLAHELEPNHEGTEDAEETPGVGAEAIPWPESGERRSFDRRQFSRAASGRRESDRSLKAQAEDLGPIVAPVAVELEIEAEPIDREPVQETAAPMELVTEVVIVGDGPATVIAASEAAGLQEPITANMAEIVAAHTPKPAIPQYDQLNVHKIIAALRKVDIKEVPELLAYEKTHKNRRSVIDAMQRLLVHGRPALA